MRSCAVFSASSPEPTRREGHGAGQGASRSRLVEADRPPAAGREAPPTRPVEAGRRRVRGELSLSSDARGPGRVGALSRADRGPVPRGSGQGDGESASPWAHPLAFREEGFPKAVGGDRIPPHEGLITQLVECHVHSVEVAGSSPAGPTTPRAPLPRRALQRAWETPRGAAPSAPRSGRSGEVAMTAGRPAPR